MGSIKYCKSSYIRNCFIFDIISQIDGNANS